MATQNPTEPVMTLAALLPGQWALLMNGDLVMRLAATEDCHRLATVVVLVDGLLLQRAIEVSTTCSPLQSATFSATWTPFPGG